MDQISIINGCKRGQEKAFKALVEKYAPKLMAVCIRYLKDNDLAKDALQESLISIFKSIQTYSGIGSFEGWMTKIAVHTCLKEIRMKKSFQDLLLVDLQETKTQEIESSLEMKDILNLINELPETQRIVFNMHIVEGYSHLEIADLINIAESSSRVYLTRARRWLQEKIEKSDSDENFIMKYNS